jgi:hypothetical protein
MKKMLLQMTSGFLQLESTIPLQPLPTLDLSANEQKIFRRVKFQFLKF